MLTSERIENVLRTLPRLTVNLFSGGKHAGGQVPIQDVLLVPISARTIDESLAMMRRAVSRSSSAVTSHPVTLASMSAASA